MADAVSKFEEALVINPSKHDTLWCLGNAFTNQGILTPDIRDAEIYFKKARDCFEKALTEVSLLFMFFILCYDPVDFILLELDILSTLSFVQSPGNELYRKSLEATDKVAYICLFSSFTRYSCITSPLISIFQ